MIIITTFFSSSFLYLMTSIASHTDEMLGFQDTVVALAGLAGLAERLSAADPRVNLRLIYGARGKNLQVNSANTMLLQRVEVSLGCESMFC